jgi:hypothetical protein
MTGESTLELFGDLRKAEREVRAYGDAIRRFDATHPNPHMDFPDKWVGVYENEIVTADTLDELFEELERRAIPRIKTFVRFVDRDPDTFYYPG